MATISLLSVPISGRNTGIIAAAVSYTHLDVYKRQEPVETAELRFPILKDDFRSYGESVIAGVSAYAKTHSWNVAPDNREGIRVSFGKGRGDGWFLLRLSVHDPIMPLNIESDTAGGTRLIAEQLNDFLMECQGLDRKAMDKFLA